MPALLEAAVCGHGLVAVTRAWGDTMPGLEHVMELEHIRARPMWLVMHPDVAKRPAVRPVADRLIAAFSAAAH